MLDVADLARDQVTVPCAFKAAVLVQARPGENIERITRRMVAERLRRDGVIAGLIDKIKELFGPATDGTKDG